MSTRKGSTSEKKSDKSKACSTTSSSMSNMNFKCPVCELAVEDEQKGIECEICKRWHHIGCVDLTDMEYEVLAAHKTGTIHWYCTDCNVRSVELLRLVFGLQERIQKNEREMDKMRSETNAKISKIESKYEAVREDLKILNDGLRSYINCDWNDEFVKVSFEVEPMWNIIKDKIETGVKRFIPLSASCNCTKWKRPLKEEIRDQIKIKKILWRKYIHDKSTANWLKYTSQRNKVKKLIRDNLKDEQNIIAQQYKSNPKKFWKYVNGRTKHTEKVGDLKLKDEQGETVICSSAKDKAGALCRLHSSVVFLITNRWATLNYFLIRHCW